MDTFADVLRRYRERRRISQATLASEIDVKPQYISALENVKGGKAPSLKVLHRLVNSLGAQGLSTDWRLAAELSLAAIGVAVPFEMPITMEQEIAEQRAVPTNSEIWILSDLFAEAILEEFAQATAENIRRGVKYSYFVPFELQDLPARAAVDSIRQAGRLADDDLHRSIQLFGISNCAFTCRLRITNPGKRSPSARYSVGSSARGDVLFYDAPLEMVTKTASVLHTLIYAQKTSQGDKPVGSPEIGYVKKFALAPAQQS
jgi:transcriptional regulator with XRE-family HTH domain